MANNTAIIKRWAPVVGGGALLACTAVYLFRRLKDRRAGEGDSSDSERGGNGKVFRGKWDLPEGAKLARPGVEDAVDQAAVESFPASDPPGFTPTRVG